MNGWENLWALVPIATFGLVVAGMRRGGETWSGVVARAAVLWVLLAWSGANLLGLFAALRPGPLRIFWLVAAGSAFFWARSRAGGRARAAGPVAPGWEWPLVAGVLVLLGLTGLVAAVAPPATVDVLSYHLPRQLMWLQNGSLGFFSTLNDRMLMMPPLAEVVGVQFLGITGDDRWVNLPEWAAYAMLPVLAVGVVRRLGGGTAGGWLAAWLILTLPMAYHEATSAKNDLLGAFWFTVVLLEVLRARAGGGWWRDGLWLGGAAGAALLTKSTAFLFLPPLAVAAAWAWRRSGGHSRLWRTAGPALVAVLLVTGPFFARNVAWYGTPLGMHRAEDGGQQANARVDPGVVASNLLRNATLHLAGPFPGWNERLEGAVRAVHGVLGLDADDPATTLWITKYDVAYSPGEETEAGAPVQALVILLVMAAVWRVRSAAPARWLAVVVVAMILAYALVLKWQPWGARLQLPVFVAGSLLAAVVVARLAPRRTAVWLAAGFVIGCVAWWPARETRLRPWRTSPTVFEVGRDPGRQRQLTALTSRDRRVVELIKQAGLRETVLLSVHDSVYPLMRALRREVPEFRFVVDRAAAPESLLVCEYFRPLELTRTWFDGTRYRLVGDEAGDGLFLREDILKRVGWEDRVPAVAGWSRQSGLNMAISGEWPETPQLVWRQLAGPVAHVYFTADQDDQFWVGLTVVKGRPRSMDLSVRVNGREAGKSDGMEGAAERVDWDFRVPVRRGVNEVELRAAEGDWGEMIFTRVQISPRRILRADQAPRPSETGP